MKGKKQIPGKKTEILVVKTDSGDLYNKICLLVEDSKASIAVAVNGNSLYSIGKSGI